MSVKVMGLVWDHFPDGGGMMLTALALADRAGHDGGEIFYSIGTIARKTRQSERSIQYHLRAMEQSGWLVEVEKGGGRRNTTTYRMPIERIPQAVVGTPQILHRLEAPDVDDEIDAAAAQIRANVQRETVQSTTRKGADADAKRCNPRHERVQPIAPNTSLSVKHPKETPALKRRMPPGFCVSEAVKTWAAAKGFGPFLEAYLEKFIGHVKANAPKYADWDAALMNCIRDDWGGVRAKMIRNGEAAQLVATDWWKSSIGIENKGIELGLERGDDAFPHFKARVFEAAGAGPWNEAQTAKRVVDEAQRRAAA